MPLGRRSAVFDLRFAREPDWIVMDDPTAQLDETTEKSMYELIAARLHAATVVSLTNRPAPARYHTRTLGAAGARARAAHGVG